MEEERYLVKILQLSSTVARLLAKNHEAQQNREARNKMGPLSYSLSELVSSARLNNSKHRNASLIKSNKIRSDQAR